MNGKVAKKIRKSVYADLSLKDRKMFIHSETKQIFADKKRREYKAVKRLVLENKRNVQ